MSQRIDHVAEAMKCIQWAHDHSAPEMLDQAQVHATLALVEQQRVANLIALGQVRIGATDLPPYRYLVAEPFGEYDIRPPAEIREALGLS